jgi:hypothetical protein
MLFASGRAFYRAYHNGRSPLRHAIILSRRDGNCFFVHGFIKYLERALGNLHEHAFIPKTTMSYFLARYLYRKYKNRNRASEADELNEHQERQEHQQVPNFADQVATGSEADGVNSHAVPCERDRSAENRQVPAKNRSQKLKSVPLCEHQLATANGTNPLNGGAASDEKAPESRYRHIPDEKRGPKNCPECIAEKKQGQKYRWKLILSLLIPNMMASMDLTITASALPIIASHFSTFYINQETHC